MFKKMSILFSLMMVLSGVIVPHSYGQEYPTKPIEILVPYVAGIPMDILCRLVADKAPKYLGQPMVVINKPGASGSVAAADIINSKPDGYKLIILTNHFFATTTKTQKVPFNPSDLTPVVNFMRFQEGICVRGDAPWKTFRDLLNFAKENPGKLKWNHSGRGMAQHIIGLLIFRQAGVETVDIPYSRGSTEKMAALLGGHVDASFLTYGTVKDHIKAGTLRFLVSISDKRWNDLPDVPTVVELGFPEVGKLVTYGPLFIHARTPEKIRKILLEAFKKIHKDPEFKKGFEKVGEEIRFDEPEFIKDSIKKGEELCVPIIKEFGLYAEK